VFDSLMEMTGGRGPDSVIDAVGMEAHAVGAIGAYDRVKQAMMAESDRPHVLREAIMACRSGGTVSVIGVYSGFIDKFPMGSVMNRSLTIKTGQCHVQRYMRPLLEQSEKARSIPASSSPTAPALRMRPRCTKHSATSRTSASKWS